MKRLICFEIPGCRLTVVALSLSTHTPTDKDVTKWSQ